MNALEFELQHGCKGKGMNVFSVYEEARGMSDEDIIAKANREDLILITNDKDFGEKFIKKVTHIRVLFF